MNKKVKDMFLAGAVIFSLAGVAVSCTNYDDDIDKLQGKTSILETQVKDLTTKLTQAQNDIAGLKTSVSELQGAVTTLQGAVKDLQDVSKTHATKEELEAAKTELTNKINSVKSELESKISALRSDLEKKIAAAEKNANTYTDNAVANALKEAKAYIDQMKAAVDKALEGKVDVTTFNETVKRIDEAAASLEKRVKAAEEDLVKVHAELDSLKNVTATNGNNIAANKEEIAKSKAELEALSAKLDAALAKLGGELKGLEFVSQCVVDGEPAIDMATYAYNPLSGDKKDSKDETWTAGDTTNSLNGKLFAEYYLNPSNASVSASDDFSYILNQGGNTPFVVTRGKASSGFAVTPTFESVADGKVKVSVDVKGTPADGDYISIINLKVSTGDTSVVSNDHTLYRHEIEDVIIANKKENTANGTYKDIEDQHYRTLLGTADPVSYLANSAVWNESYEYANNIDTVVTKDAPLNLKGIVALHDKINDAEYTDEQFANYGFSWKFELVKNYKINGVDQADFVELSDSVLTVNEKKGQAAFGRTPVVRVTLLDGENVVKVAYIKVGITGEDIYEVDPLLNGTEETNTFAFACADADTLIATYAQMKSQVYDKVGMADSTFNKDYSVYVDNDKTKGATSIVKVAEGGDSVHVIRWIVPMDSIVAWSGKTITKEVCYKSAAGSNLRINVKLSAKVEELVAVETALMKESDFAIKFCNSCYAYVIGNTSVSGTEANGEFGKVREYKHSGEWYASMGSHSPKLLLRGTGKGWTSLHGNTGTLCQPDAATKAESGFDDYDYTYTDFHSFGGRRRQVAIVVDMKESVNVASIGLVNWNRVGADSKPKGHLKSVEFYVSDDAEFTFTPAKGSYRKDYDYSNYANPNENNWTLIAKNANLPVSVDQNEVQWVDVPYALLVSGKAKGRFLKIRFLENTGIDGATGYSARELYVKKATNLD